MSSKDTRTADVAFAVRDSYHNKGIGTELSSCLTYLPKKQGFLGFTGEMFMDRRPMLYLLCRKMGFDIEEVPDHGVYERKMMLRKRESSNKSMPIKTQRIRYPILNPFRNQIPIQPESISPCFVTTRLPYILSRSKPLLFLLNLFPQLPQPPNHNLFPIAHSQRSTEPNDR